MWPSLRSHGHVDLHLPGTAPGFIVKSRWVSSKTVTTYGRRKKRSAQSREVWITRSRKMALWKLEGEVSEQLTSYFQVQDFLSRWKKPLLKPMFSFKWLKKYTPSFIRVSEIRPSPQKKKGWSYNHHGFQFLGGLLLLNFTKVKTGQPTHPLRNLQVYSGNPPWFS